MLILALIKCPECGREISDKSTQCVHCGFPLNDILHAKSEELLELECPWCGVKDQSIIKGNVKVCNGCGYIFNDDYINDCNELLPHTKLPRCPKCGSTAITAGQRGYSLLTGFLGSNKTVNRCANCGHTWKPGR